MASGWRGRVLDVARSRGLEPRLRELQRLASSKEQRRSLRDEHHLELALALTLPRDACCVDVGANVGGILQHLVRLAPDGDHVAFEPLPELAADLAARFPGVDVRNAAVADEPGERTFRRVVGAHSRSGFHVEGYDGATEELRVVVEVLDEVVPVERRVAVLKIDVEGAELEVLRGAERILSRDRPLVVVEHGGPPDVSRALHALLTGHGLRVFDLEGAGPLDEQAFLAAIATGDRWNFAAHP